MEPQLLTYAPTPPARPAALQETPAAVIDLPRPCLDGGVPLMAALASRSSCRSFAAEALPPASLGAMLWAADGINRPGSAGRTAPSAYGADAIDLYVALPGGVYRYDPLMHLLLLKHAVDARNLTGYQDFVGQAPLDLVYVVRTAALAGMPPSQLDIFAAVEAGAIAQNVALYCAAAGLGSVVRGWINHRALAEALSLNEDELPILAQTIGFPGHLAA
ncbi:nitroreductase family protein [Burkholderia glumae]|uniref:Nitroreductase family protein n=1 Tax=Burkholderia glumae TaxID=337 RepID=A0AAQ0BT66_BURGL|nr:nitroreductase family protein [Burkholderia glumae]ACR28893.1 nitroreductase [Burkholderia glumae BGR1]KHJ64345.1 nitroreductase [Burkholderia glumae]MCM2483271.1 nitroreductase family protein [Burkholderia glumae]MCM2493182.1 nitroreductase family protein [Burkholderia glumae]MCM2506588.1 nitroreductase family protein [Burkholderia glumae]